MVVGSVVVLGFKIKINPYFDRLDGHRVIRFVRAIWVITVNLELYSNIYIFDDAFFRIGRGRSTTGPSSPDGVLP